MIYVHRPTANHRLRQVVFMTQEVIPSDTLPMLTVTITGKIHSATRCPGVQCLYFTSNVYIFLFQYFTSTI